MSLEQLTTIGAINQFLEGTQALAFKRDAIYARYDNSGPLARAIQVFCPGAGHTGDTHRAYPPVLWAYAIEARCIGPAPQ